MFISNIMAHVLLRIDIISQERRDREHQIINKKNIAKGALHAWLACFVIV